MREIESVEYPNHLVSLREPNDQSADGEVQFLSVTSTKGEVETHSIAVLSDGLTTIAVPVKHTKKGVQILPLGSEVPRLFCDFPLLGTEDFPFPVIINNPTFNPSEPRDGVFLTKSERSAAESDHNRTIITGALALQREMLDYATTNGWRDLRLLASAKPMPAFIWVDQDWYKTEILKPMQTALLSAEIVRTAADTVAPIRSPDGKIDIWFPSSTNKEIRHGVWRSFKERIPHQLPAEEDDDVWHDIIWSDCSKLTLDRVAAVLSAPVRGPNAVRGGGAVGDK